MDDIWLWRVVWLRMVPDVLRRMEDLKRESIQKLTLRKQSTNWLQSPARPGLQEVGDVV